MIFALSTAMSAIVISLGAALLSMLSPLLLAYLSGRQRTQERQQEWARQDIVAERLEKQQNQIAAQAREAAELLRVEQGKTTHRADLAAARAQEVALQTQTAAQLLLQNNEKVAASTRAANTKLDVIHTLVNSNMTAALQDSLDSSRANLATLRELIALRVAQGDEPNEDTRAQLVTLENKVGRLASNLDDRIRQTKIADAQIFVAKEEYHDPDKRQPRFEDIDAEET